MENKLLLIGLCILILGYLSLGITFGYILSSDNQIDYVIDEFEFEGDGSPYCIEYFSEEDEKRHVMCYKHEESMLSFVDDSETEVKEKNGR